MIIFQNKTVLVTGATGLIGSNLVDRLMQCDTTKVIVTGRNKKKLESTFCQYLDNGNFTMVEHDVTEPIPASITNIDYIFHAAGPMERDIILSKPVNVLLPNIIGLIHFMEFLKKQYAETAKKGRIIIFSSVTVYSNPTDADYCVNEDATNIADSLDSPTASYSESKRMTEVIAKSYFKQYCIDTVIARFSTVYGFAKNIPNTAFYEFIDKAMKGEDIILKSSGFAKRDNIYIDDAIKGLLVIAEKGLSGESYNISSGGDKGNFVGVDEIAEVIALQTARVLCNPKVKVVVSEVSPQRPGLMLDNSKLKGLGWDVYFNLDDGILETIKLLS